MTLLKTQLIQEFLQRNKVTSYNPEMEVQVNVVTGKVFKDKKWSDDDYTWGPFRIPYNARDNPTYKDSPLDWPFEKYVEAIGLTGWNWFKRQSEWVGFDIDSVTNHKQGLTDDDLDKIRIAIYDVPWITLKRSKSGKGFHLYVYFKSPVSTENHTEHAALARAILGQLSVLTGIDFKAKSDIVGGVLWVWHRNTGINGFQVLKQGTPLETIPPNWRDHVSVVEKRKRTPLINSKHFEDLVSKTRQLLLDEDHLKLLKWFSNTNYIWWWDPDYHVLVCHTSKLKEAHEELNLRGIFNTISTGKDPGDYNCFCSPAKSGSWIVRRFGFNTSESNSWSIDSTGWRKCYYNRLPDLETASKMNNGVKTKNNSYIFQSFEDANSALRILGVVIPDIKIFDNRQTTLSPTKRDNEILISVPRTDLDKFESDDWAPVRGPKWERIVTCLVEIKTYEPPDDLVRYTIRGGAGYKWFINSRGKWIEETKDNVKSLLVSLGTNKNELDYMLGEAVLNSWEISNIPFAPEYPGNRQWNLNAVQLSRNPVIGQWDTWRLIINHISKNIDTSNNPWCKEHIVSGFDYLLYYIAAIFQYPFEPLPYLFLYGPQGSGKSILHEALRFLVKDEVGYAKADNCLKEVRGFNGELDKAIICAVDETNLQNSKIAGDRIKEWVTARVLAIHPKGGTVYNIKNTTHWIQTANKPSWCPIFPGDTRITVIYVDLPEIEIPKHTLEQRLIDEIPGFLHHILNVKIPDTSSRLRIPALSSNIKLELEEINKTPLESFIDEYCEKSNGYVVKFSDFVSKFEIAIDHANRLDYTTKRISSELSGIFPKGRWGDGGHIYIGNIKVKSLNAIQIKEGKVISQENRLV